MAATTATSAKVNKQHFPHLLRASPSPSSPPCLARLTNKSLYIDDGPGRIREIPERCSCQDDARIADRQALGNEEREEQFWRNLHIFTGLQSQHMIFGRDEKARKDEESKHAGTSPSVSQRRCEVQEAGQKHGEGSID